MDSTASSIPAVQLTEDSTKDQLMVGVETGIQEIATTAIDPANATVHLPADVAKPPKGKLGSTTSKEILEIDGFYWIWVLMRAFNWIWRFAKFLKSMAFNWIWVLMRAFNWIWVLVMAFNWIWVLVMVLLPSVKAADKPPTFEYGIIGKNNNAPPSKAHPPPVNAPTRGCNPENFCRNFTLRFENHSGTRVEAVALVEMRAPLYRSEVGTEAIAAGIAAWSLNKTTGNASGWLSVSLDPIANATDSAQMSQLLAVYRGITNMGLKVQYRSASMSKEDEASLPPVDGKITVAVGGAASNQVVLKFFTQVESLGESDVIHILEYAKVKLSAIRK